MSLVTPILTRLLDRIAVERFVIPRTGERLPYLTRWTLRGKRFEGTGGAVYVHHFQRSDRDEMHSHPWGFTSIILAGGYYEVTPAPGWANGVGPVRRRWYGPGRVLTRPVTHVHRVEIPDGRDCWTLLLRGPKEQSWGFFCPVKGFINWRLYEANLAVGKGGCE